MSAAGATHDAAQLHSILDWDVGGEDLHRRSALEVLAQVAAYSAFTDARYSLDGGNDLLPMAFASALGHRVHYNATVEVIEQNQAGVTIHFTRGPTTQILAADHAVIALPLARVATMNFEPMLSAEKRRSIHEVGYASVSRACVQCRLHFAGEHLGPLLFRGLAQAGVESGRSAAHEVLEASG